MAVLTVQLDVLLDDARLDIVVPVLWHDCNGTVHLPSHTLAPILNLVLWQVEPFLKMRNVDVGETRRDGCGKETSEGGNEVRMSGKVLFAVDCCFVSDWAYSLLEELAYSAQPRSSH